MLALAVAVVGHAVGSNAVGSNAVARRTARQAVMAPPRAVACPTPPVALRSA